MTRARMSPTRQRGEYVKHHGGAREKKPDVTLTGVTLGRETEKAILVKVKDQADPIWMPLSQVTKMVRAGDGPDGSDSITITAWIAEQKGLA